MTIYKNISIENIREQKTNKEKRKENKQKFEDTNRVNRSLKIPIG
jgi:hypothetical protein